MLESVNELHQDLNIHSISICCSCSSQSPASQSYLDAGPWSGHEYIHTAGILGRVGSMCVAAADIGMRGIGVGGMVYVEIRIGMIMRKKEAPVHARAA
jgi:hypothetical protein